jgi:hypothetical protein
VINKFSCRCVHGYQLLVISYLVITGAGSSPRPRETDSPWRGEWSAPGGRDIDCTTRGARVRAREAIESIRPSADQMSEDSGQNVSTPNTSTTQLLLSAFSAFRFSAFLFLGQWSVVSSPVVHSDRKSQVRRQTSAKESRLSCRRLTPGPKQP